MKLGIMLKKKASVQPLINSYENGELSGAVLTSMPDDSFDQIAKIVEEHLDFVNLVCSMQPHWLDYSFTKLCAYLEKLKRRNGIIGIKIHPPEWYSVRGFEAIEKLVAAARHVGLILYVCTILRNPVGSITKPPHTIIRNL